MTDPGPYPFDPAKLAGLARLARETNAAGAPAPIATPVAIDEKGMAWLPNPGEGAGTLGCYVHAGLRMGWIPAPELGGLLVSQFGGHAAGNDYEEEGLVAFFTTEGLRTYARHLLAIADAAEVAR